MAQQNTELVGTLLDGRYKVVRMLGKGAMGTVYEGQHVTVGRRLAIKVLARKNSSSAARERFFHEARAAGAIAHPNIVPVVDFGFIDSNQPYIVMDFVEGQTLEDLINRAAPMDLDDAVEICCQVLSALEVIHGSGLVHRDIKPANIMLERVRRPRYLVRLLDFGVSRAVHAMWQRPDLTRANEILGTPAYFSPEQAAGRDPDPRWDVWSVAILFYEMLTGDLPYRLESMTQVFTDLAKGRLIPLRKRRPGLPDWVYQVQERAHHPAPEKRYATATSLLQALEQRQPFLPDEDRDARTVPRLKVDLATPPPEILGQLSKGEERKAAARLAEERTRAAVAALAAAQETRRDPRKEVGQPPPVPPEEPASVEDTAQDEAADGVTDLDVVSQAMASGEATVPVPRVRADDTDPSDTAPQWRPLPEGEGPEEGGEAPEKVGSESNMRLLPSDRPVVEPPAQPRGGTLRTALLVALLLVAGLGAAAYYYLRL